MSTLDYPPEQRNILRHPIEMFDLSPRLGNWMSLGNLIIRSSPVPYYMKNLPVDQGLLCNTPPVEVRSVGSLSKRWN